MSNSDPRYRIRIATLKVLDVFLADPGRCSRCGVELCKATGLGSGSVTDILLRLERWRWLSSEWEDAETAHRQGRPRRRFYRLTQDGEREAREAIRRTLPGLTEDWFGRPA